MDAETKAALAGIIEAKKLKSTKRERTRIYEHRPRPGFYPGFTTPPQVPPTDPTEGRCWDIDEEAMTEVNTKNEWAIISLDPSKAAAILRTAYNPAFIGAMKDRISSSQRRWDSENKVWVFHPDVLPALKSIIELYYAGVRVVGVQKQIAATKFDQLMAKLKADDKQAIYILLMKRYHPDRGGDKETAALINTVFEK
jgi:hypothetical protein